MEYTILTKKPVKSQEDLPCYFLGQTIEQAESLYGQFEKTLNDLARTFAAKSGLELPDLFGEALVGLAKAARDWDSKRSGDFKTYAIYRIKDTLREFVRKNRAIVSIPSYVKKAERNLDIIRNVCRNYGVDPIALAKQREIPQNFVDDDIVKCVTALGNLMRASNRAGMDYATFISRVEVAACSIEEVLTDVDAIGSERDPDLVVLVGQLQTIMSDEERAMCDGLMVGETLQEIGVRTGLSPAGVHKKLLTLRERLLEHMKGAS